MTTPKKSPTLRPLSLGELLDRAIRLYRRNFFKFIGIIAVVQIPITIISLIVGLFTISGMSSQLMNPSAVQNLENVENPFALLGPNFFSGIGISLIVGLVSIFLLAIAMAAVTRLVADAYLGERIGAIEAYFRIEDRVPALFGTLITNFLVGVVVFIWFLIPCIGWLTGSSMLSVLAYILIPLTVPVVILEGFSGFNALRRAWELVRRRFWPVIIIAVVLYLFNQLVVAGPAYLISLIFQYLTPGMINSGNAQLAIQIQTVIQTLVSMIFSLLYLPLQLACMTLLYFDLRVRQEGLDLVLAAEEQPGISAAELVANAPKMPQGNFMSWGEVGNFAILSVGGGIIFFIFSLLFGLLSAGLGLATTGGL